MSSGSSSHLSKSKQDDDPRHSIEHHSPSVSPLRDGAIESAFVPSTTTLPYEAEEWKQNFAPYYSGCVVPAVSQNSSLLSQIVEDSDPLNWTMTPPSGTTMDPKLTQPASEQLPDDVGVSHDIDETDSKKQAEKEKNRARMRRLRAARDQEKIESDREKARERTRRVRASWNEERRQKERQRARDYMRRRRAMKSKQHVVGQRRTHSPDAA